MAFVRKSKEFQLNILHLEAERYSAKSINAIKKVGTLHLLPIDVSQEDLHHKLSSQQFDTIFTRLGLYLGKSEMDLQDNLKFIVTPTTGLNHIDLGEAHKRGIEVISLKGESIFLNSIKSTAEHTWMLLLSLVRNLIPAYSDVKAGHWNRVPHLASEFNTHTIGIIGLGRLGKMLVRYAEAFSMNILCNDIDDSVFTDEYHTYKSSLEELLSESDYIILQIDYRPENRHFINADKLGKMKPGSYFINTSRGEMVDEEALVYALESGKSKGAALDVLYGDSIWEGKTGSSSLLDYAKDNDNLIITPHMGGYGKTSIEKTRTFITHKFIKLAY